MADKRYKAHAGGVYSLKYHYVWCPKYRRPVLVDEVADDLRGLLLEKAEAIGVEVEAMEIMPNHVHIFVSSDPTEAPQRIVNQFKGYTSRILRKKHESLRRRLPTLWSRSYYVGSIGHASEEAIRRYIEDQKGK